MDDKLIENVEYATDQATAKYKRKPLFACLFCGGAKSCENLKSAGYNALCLSWGQKIACPEIAKIIPILDSLLLQSETLSNAVVVCSEHVSKQRTSTMAYSFKWQAMMRLGYTSIKCHVAWHYFASTFSRKLKINYFSVKYLKC